jgi:predicted AAA+ superfamily ATPase
LLKTLSDTSIVFERGFVGLLAARLREPRRFLQVVAGPRQVGKTTIVQQVFGSLAQPTRLVSADEPSLHDRTWIAQQWEVSRLAARDAVQEGAVLAVDEVHKVPGWSETVKRLWDEDTRASLPLKVVLLGSSSLLLQQGLTESLAGRFELIHVPHWSLVEMRHAFGWDLDRYLVFGGYPGPAALVGDVERSGRATSRSL